MRCAVTRSLVQIEQVSPYSTWLTSASILSSSLHLNTESTGPKISSLPIRIFMVTSAKMVGSMNRPLASAGLSGRLPPVTRRAPSSLPAAMYFMIRSYCTWLMIEPMVVAGSVGMPGL